MRGMVGCSLFAACIRFAFAILRGLDEKSRHVWGTLSSLARSSILMDTEAACDEDETCETGGGDGDGDGDGDDDASASCKKQVNRKPQVKGANMKGTQETDSGL